MRHHYLKSPLGTPGMAAGWFLTLAPLLGVWLGRNFGAAAWLDAAPYLGAGVLLLAVKRGITVLPDTREIRVWYGLGFTRFLALPLWRARRRDFRIIQIRSVEVGSSKGIKPHQPAVFLADADSWIEVRRTWTHRGALRVAERLARQTGLPIG